MKNAKASINDVIDRFFNTHGSLYDYSEVEYTNSQTKVKIKCVHHGVFYQAPVKHYGGNGCPSCARTERGLAQRLQKDQFLEKAQLIHENRYDYSNTILTTSGTKIAIRCAEHGIFFQTPDKHLSGQGCYQCGIAKRGVQQRTSKSGFIEKAQAVHGDRYDYSIVDYQGAHKHVQIICYQHGEFRQTPHNHKSGNGCPACTVGKRRSKAAQKWLDTISASDLILEYQIPENKRLFVDGFSPSTNTVYQFHGDYWHGNPNVFDGKAINAHNKSTFGSLYSRTQMIEAQLQGYGYHVVVMWEFDWNQRSALERITRSTNPSSTASSGDMK